MIDLVDEVLRLQAIESGRAVRSAARRQVRIRGDARIVAALAMAGEDTGVHAVALGPLDGEPEVLVTPDPRKRHVEYELLREFASHIEPYFDGQRRAGEYPQLIVPSNANAEHLDTLAERIRYSDDDEMRRFGALLTYPAERRRFEGQQALLTATHLLTAHYRTGQAPEDDAHLGALLAWIDPTPGIDVFEAIEAAEREPMGVKTDPEFDNAVLAPLVDRYNEALKDDAAAAERIADLIRAELTAVVLRVYRATRRAVELVRALPIPDFAPLDRFEDFERREYAWHMRVYGHSDHRLALRDRPKAAAMGLIGRERVVANVGAERIWHDPVYRVRAVIAGHALVARVDRVLPRTRDGRRTIHRLELVTEQDVLHLRVGTSLFWAERQNLTLEVEQLRRDPDGRRRLRVRVVSGMRVPGVPTVGSWLELLQDRPDWGAVGRDRGLVRDRMTELPWTHETEEE